MTCGRSPQWAGTPRSTASPSPRHTTTATVIPGTPGVLSAPALWWAATTASLPALDLKSLRGHLPGLHWAPFREDFAAFADWAKTATST